MINEVETVSAELEELLEAIPSPPQEVIVCKLCRHRLADADLMHNINGKIEHEFTNPFGIVHRFRSYNDAPGCKIQGSREAADTWFLGYTWRICTCGKCDTFLGWLFEANDSFFGLLISKITQENLRASSGKAAS